jgi:hypothetical protein
LHFFGKARRTKHEQSHREAIQAKSKGTILVKTSRRFVGEMAIQNRTGAFASFSNLIRNRGGAAGVIAGSQHSTFINEEG